MNTRVVEMIRSGEISGNDKNHWTVPVEAEMIGRGMTRVVFAIDNVVVKIGDRDVNEFEAHIAQKLRNDSRLPSWCYIPETICVEGIVIQERIAVEKPTDCYIYVIGRGHCECGTGEKCWALKAQELCRQFDLCDLHCENVSWDGKTMIPFDLGCS